MSEVKPAAIIISASSDIGIALSHRWLDRGWDVFGTYRSRSSAVDDLLIQGAKLVFCDLTETDSMRNACSDLRSLCPQWDVLVLCPGTQEPVGPFVGCDFDRWEESVRVNFTSQMRLIHELLPSRRVHASRDPCVLMFAGPGTNNAPVNYSAYIVSKIALIKMCELLDAEIEDSKFVILGPGWVRTKMHEATIKAGETAGDNYRSTLDHFAKNDFNEIERVLDCCDWIVSAPREIVSGRNFSMVFDFWGDDELGGILRDDPNMYKLRRHGNDRLVRK